MVSHGHIGGKANMNANFMVSIYIWSIYIFFVKGYSIYNLMNTILKMHNIYNHHSIIATIYCSTNILSICCKIIKMSIG